MGDEREQPRNWQVLTKWFLVGCLSVATLNFGAVTVGKMQPQQEETQLLPSSEASSTPTLQAPVTASTSSHTSQTPITEEKQIAEAPPSNVQEYKIQPEDVLQITVYEEPDLSTKARVTGTGEINFPLLGRISVGGLSVMEAQEKITQLLAEDYLVNPQVQVFIETYHARDVFVTGAVNKPGSYPLPSGKATTLMEAIAMAGGFDEEAALNGTKVIRIENGKETTITVKAADIIKKGDKAKDVEVRPNDVVFVPESFF